MSIPLEQVVEFLAPKTVIGSRKVAISEIVRLDTPPVSSSQLFWCNDKNISQLDSLAGGTVICGTVAAARPQNGKLTYLVVENPRLGFLKVVRKFFDERPPIEIKSTAVVDSGAKVGSNVSLGHHVVIESGCSIGDGSVIGPNTVVHRNTIIGKNVIIGANNTIGGVGFGYEKDESGAYQFIPHLGNVVIEDDVEIGNNTCIDRAPLGSTRICRNVKIDNQVHVAHGCIIRENALLIAHAMIGGSTEIGEGAWIAPSSSIKNGISVGAGALVGLGAVVIGSVEPNAVVVGNPARPRPKPEAKKG